MNNPIQSISDFMQASDFAYYVFDLGKRVSLLSNEDFYAIEQQQQTYPYPLQQAAWLGIVFHQQENVEAPIIWFLKFPLDELGYIQLEAKDAFLRQVLEHLGENIMAQQQGENHTDALKESAYAFKPKQDRLAVFHAKITKILNKPASQFYSHVRDYLQGKIGYEQWAFLGLQGLADFVVRLDEDDNEQILADAIAKLPDTPLLTISELLESSKPQRCLSLAMQTRLQTILSSSDHNAPAIAAALLRGLSNSQEAVIRNDVCKLVLASNVGKNLDLLVVISGRMWADLLEETLLKQYLENAAYVEQAVFNALLVDLMAMPNMREAVLTQLRNPERSEVLATRIGQFMQALQTK